MTSVSHSTGVEGFSAGEPRVDPESAAREGLNFWRCYNKLITRELAQGASPLRPDRRAPEFKRKRD